MLRPDGIGAWYYPLLDLKEAWQEAERALRDVEVMADALYTESMHTWAAIQAVQHTAQDLRASMRTLPQAIIDAIDEEQREYDAQCDRAEAQHG